MLKLNKQEPELQRSCKVLAYHFQSSEFDPCLRKQRKKRIINRVLVLRSRCVPYSPDLTWMFINGILEGFIILVVKCKCKLIRK